MKPLTLKVPVKEEVFAEKIYAYTFPREKENTRAKDLLDLALLLQDGVDRDKVRTAINRVFPIRKTHAIPAELPMPAENWHKVFAELVRDTEIDLTVDTAFQKVSEFFKTLNL